MAPHTRMCMRANRFVVSLGLISTMMLGLFGGPVALAQSDGDRSIAASPWSSIRISLVQDETLNQEVAYMAEGKAQLEIQYCVS